MNLTLTSSDIVASLSLQLVQFFIVFLSHGSTHAAGLKGEISGDLTDISSAEGALCVVKRTEKGNEPHVGLARRCGKSLITTSASSSYLSHLKHPRRWFKG